MDEFAERGMELIAPGRASAMARRRSPAIDARTVVNAGTIADGGLLDYMQILRRWRRLMVSAALAGLFAGVAAYLIQHPVYEATEALEIQSLNENFLNMQEVSPTTQGGATAASGDLQTQLRLLRNHDLTERAVHTLAIDPRLRGLRPPPRIWEKLLNLEPPVISSVEAEARQTARTLKVRAVGQSRVVEVLASSRYPEIAAAFVSALSNAYIEDTIENRWKMTQRTGETLTRLVEDVRQRLVRSEGALQGYAEKYGLLFDPDHKKMITEDKLSQLQQELSRVQASRIAAQSRYEIAKAGAAESLPDVLNDSALREYTGKLNDLRRQRAEMVIIYTPEHAKVRRLDAQIASIESALSAERTSVLERIQNDYYEAVRRERLLDEQYNLQNRLVSVQSERAIHYNVLQREVDSNRQLYDAMLQRVKDATIASAMRASNIRVADPARPPARPSGPSLFLNCVLGLFGGVFVGACIVIARERGDRCLRQPGDAGACMEVIELGAVLHDPSEGRGGLMRLLPRMGQRERVSLNPASRDLVTWYCKPDEVLDSFRAVLTSILFSSERSDTGRVLVVTSPGPNEGKTTVATNLGMALAEIRRRVLLIDADLRAPALSELFGLPASVGLSDILDPHVPFEDIIHRTRVAGISVVGAGSCKTGHAHLLHSPRLGEFLRLMRAQFDVILVDTPPALQMPEARVLGRMSDGVVFVARSGKTTWEAAAATARRFVSDGARLIGVILNDWEPSAGPSGYYRYYHQNGGRSAKTHRG